MVPISDVPVLLRNTIFEWRNTRIADLLFARRGTAVLALVVLIGVALGLMIVRAATRRKAGLRAIYRKTAWSPDASRAEAAFRARSDFDDSMTRSEAAAELGQGRALSGSRRAW